MNPVIPTLLKKAPSILVLVALLFFVWLWGAVGLLIAMPLLVVIKVIASRIDGLDAVAHFLKD